MYTAAGSTRSNVKLTFGENIEITIAEGGGDSDEPSTADTSYTTDNLTVNGAVGYGGAVAIDQETGAFTFTATDSGTYHYVLDQIFVDGVALADENIQGAASYTWYASDLEEGATGTHSVVATFAYTVNFQPPANGTLSVSRGSETLKSGDIVRGGDVLTITYSDPTGAYDGELKLTGITDNGDGTYTVTAQNGEPTPAISVSLTPRNTVEMPVISPASGEVESGSTFTATITCATEDAAIYYTTDGSTPTAASALYTGPVPVTVTDDTTLKAVAVKDGWNNSPVAEATYTVKKYAVSAEGGGTISFYVGNTKTETPPVGSEVMVAVTAPENYRLTKLTYTYEGLTEPISISNYGSFTMPAADVTVTAEYERVYTVTSIRADHAVCLVREVGTGNGGYQSAAGTQLQCTVYTIQPNYYVLESVTYTYEGLAEPVDITDTLSFTMPAADVTITVVFRELAKPAITFASRGGFSFTVNGIANTVAIENDAIEVKVTPPLGHTLSRLTYTYEGLAEPVDITESLSFTMPAVDVTVTAEYEPTFHFGPFPAEGDGTEESPYLITTAEQLVELAERVNTGDDQAGVSYALANDVSLSTVCGSGLGDWIPIGKYVEYLDGVTLTGVFRGNFDGRGHEIRDLYGAHLFGYVENGTIENLTVAGNTTSGAGIIYSAANETIRGCVNLVNVTVYNGYVAGIVFQAADTEISGCANYGALTSQHSGFVGGITASATGATTIDSCVNYGTIYSFSAAAGISVGGTVTNCVNRGSVTSISGFAMGIGGSVITNCYNAGSITAVRNTGWTGWIAMGISSAGTVTNSYNVGTLTSDCERPTSGDALGGYFPITLDGTAENCYWLDTCIGERKMETYAGTEKTAEQMQDPGFVTALNGEGGTAFVSDNGINGGYPILTWEAEAKPCTVSLVLQDPTGKANLSLFGSSTLTSEAVTQLTVPSGGYVVFSVGGFSDGLYRIGSVSVGEEDLTGYKSGNVARTSYHYAVTEDCTITIAILPKDAGDVTPGDNENVITGDGKVPASLVWDGVSVDVSWYFGHENDTVYEIGTAAQLAGVAALVNGLVNENCVVYTGTTTYSAAEWNDLESGYVFQAGNLGSGSLGQNMSTEIYHYGIEDFNGKTILLTENIDMGGVYDATTDTWSGPNYMPIGGQYLVTKNDSSTKLSSSFCGTFDGDGHYVYNIYCDRHCETGNFGDGQSVGLIGRLGVHDNDPVTMRPTTPTVKNVGVTGYIYANRSVAGIVGKVGKTAYNNTENISDGAVIENCVNYARVIGTDAKGTAGVVGANWNGGFVRNCYNMGNVTGGWPAGGVVGTNENTLQNCYNAGMVDSTSGANWAEAIGTYNGSFNEAVLNCYYLEGSASNYGYYKNNKADTTGEMTADAMKDPGFVTLLNGFDNSGTYVADTLGINGGFPLLAWQLTNEESEIIIPPSISGGSEPAVQENAAETTTTVEDGAATVTVNGDALTEAADAADENTQFVISGELEGETVTSVTTVIPMPAVKAVADSGASIQTQTPLGDVALSNAALKNLASQDGENLTVTVKSGGDGTTAITVSVDDTAADTVSGGLQAVIPAESGNVAVLVNPGGSETVIPKSIVENGTAYVLLPGSAVVKVIDNAKDFTDVKDSDWYSPYVDFASSHELFNGVGDGQFAPNGTMTRAMLVTVLHRLEGTPAAAASGAFDDVPTGTWYTDAVAWASGNGIVEGYGNGCFGPDDSVTREQIATILYRYMQYLGLDVSGQGSLSKFVDGSATSDWAYEAMQWAVGAGIIEGYETGMVNPGGVATRAEVATMLQRLIDLIVK